MLARSYVQISPAPFYEKHHYSPVQAFLADVPTQKRYFIFGTMFNSPQPMHIITITLFIFTTDRYCYLLSVSEIEAILCLQAISSVSAFPFAYYFLKIVVLHACTFVLNLFRFNTNESTQCHICIKSFSV